MSSGRKNTTLQKSFHNYLPDASTDRQPQIQHLFSLPILDLVRSQQFWLSYSSDLTTGNSCLWTLGGPVATLNPGEAGSQGVSCLSQLLQMENLCWRYFLVEFLQTSSIPGFQGATFLSSEFVSGTAWSGNGKCENWELRMSSHWTGLSSRTSRLFHLSVTLSVKWE